MPRLGWVILLCVTVDFSDPMLPGSVRFDPSESIEAVRGDAAPLNVFGPLPARQPDRREVRRRLTLGPPGPALLATPGWRWFPGMRPARHRSDDLPAALPTEDH